MWGLVHAVDRRHGRVDTVPVCLLEFGHSAAESHPVPDSGEELAAPLECL